MSGTEKPAYGSQPEKKAYLYKEITAESARMVTRLILGPKDPLKDLLGKGVTGQTKTTLTHCAECNDRTEKGGNRCLCRAA